MFAGVSSANHDTTGALNGPVYDWLKNNDDIQEYGLAQPASIYFSGSYLDVDVVLVRTAMDLIDRDNEYDEYADLPQEMRDAIGDQNSVRESYACSQDDNIYDPTNHQIEEGEEPSDQAVECDESAEDEGANTVVDLYGGDVQNIGLIKDYTFAEPIKADIQVETNENENEDYDESPFDGTADSLNTESQWEINRWNWANSTRGWPQDASKGNSDEVVLPEDEHFDKLADDEEGQSRQHHYNNPPDREENQLTVTHDPTNDSWVAAGGMEFVIYANDPSVWVHTHRYDNVSGDMSEYEEDKLFDRSYQQIGDSGTLRVAYESGYTNSAPSGARDAPLTVSTGDTRWKYEGGNVETTGFDVYIKSPDNITCESECELTGDAIDINKEDGVATIHWDLEESDWPMDRLKGHRVEFIVKTEYEVSYDKQIQTANVFCDERADAADAESNPGLQEGDCKSYQTNWNDSSRVNNFIEETATYETSEEYYFTRGTGIFENPSNITVKKADFPDSPDQYYVKFDQENENGDIIGWNKITAGDGATVQSQWKYFSSREKAWDDLYTQTDSTNGSKYVSDSKPLRIHAYPAYEYYNEQDSTVDIIDPERADLDTDETRPSPALVGHETCVQNYPQEFSDDEDGPSGSYEKHEPCYWEVFAAGQDRFDPPISYYSLPYRVTNPGWLSAIPGIADNQMGYEEYVFNRDLSEILQSTNDDTEEESSAYQKLYTGEYSHMDEIVFESPNDVDEVTIYGMVPESKTTAEVEETVQVTGTDLDVEIVEKCEIDEQQDEVFNCQEGSVASSQFEAYKLSMELTRINEEGEEVPINTSDIDGDITVQNPLYEPDSPTLSLAGSDSTTVSTDDNGEATVWIEEPDDVSDPLVDVKFEPEHWRTASDPIAPAEVVGDGRQGVEEHSWLLTLSGIMLVYWFMTLVLNKGILAESDLNITPFKDIVYDNAGDYTRKFLALAIVAIVVFQGPESWYDVTVFMIALLLLISNWNAE